MEFQKHVLREYALLADGHRGAVVGPRGDVVWLCLPRWDSDAVMSGLLGGPGGYAVTPTATDYVWGGHYEDGSLVWRNRWVTTAGVLECRDALAFPGDPKRAIVLRQIICHRGSVRIEVSLDVRAGFGRESMTRLSRSGDTWTASSGELRLRWSGATEAVRRRGALHLALTLTAGDQHDLVLELSEGGLPDERVNSGVAWAETESAWRRAVPRLGATVAPRDARQAYAVLRGMTAPGAGMVAAATTSLPERADAGRNYDYRYAWIRDQCFAGQAVAADGAHELLDDAVSFVSSRLLEHGSDLAPAYTVDGGQVPEQVDLDLPGYPGGGAVRGNWVRSQFQLDAFGEALLLLGAAGAHDHLDTEHWRAAEAAVRAIEQRGQDPGAGIWETQEQHWTHSRLIGAAGLRSIARYAPIQQASAWNGLADTLVQRVGADSMHRSGRWQRSPTDPRVDASLLLPAIRGAVPAGDPRTRATLQAVEEELADDYVLYRFRHDERPLNEAEGAFLVCGFHMALAQHQQGNETEALRWFERNRTACGSPGLLTEEFDVVQRQLRGNLPQAFVHALLLEAGSRLATPWVV